MVVCFFSFVGANARDSFLLLQYFIDKVHVLGLVNFLIDWLSQFGVLEALCNFECIGTGLVVLLDLQESLIRCSFVPWTIMYCRTSLLQILEHFLAATLVHIGCWNLLLIECNRDHDRDFRFASLVESFCFRSDPSLLVG